MIFMVIEHFEAGRIKDIYRRFAERGRMAPDGLRYIDSWVAADFSRCFQLMESPDVAKLQEWVISWSDLVRFEIVPVASSAETASVMNKHL